MTNLNAPSKTAAAVEGRELIVTRSFSAPMDLVFRAWTDPKHLPQWWGPKQFTTTVQEIDVRPGGVWTYVMHGPDGTDYDNKITFLEIEPSDRIVYLHGDNTDDELFRVTVTLEEQGRNTLLTMRSLFKTAEILAQSVREYGAVEGAASTLDRLEDQLPNVMLVSARDRTFTIDRLFDAPRELVFKAFTESEHLKKWWGPRGWEVTHSDMDFRPGGSWHYCFKCMDKNQGDFYGMESWGLSVYHDIVPAEKIVYTDYFSDAEGNRSEQLPPTDAILTFIEYGGKTRVVSESIYSTEEGLQTVIDMGMEQGITETWDRLAEHLQAIK